MAYACVDGIEQTGSIHSLPITLDQRASATSTVVVGTFIFFAACFLLAPFGLVAALAALDPNSFMAIAQNPSTAIQLGLALLVGIMFVALPLRRLLRRVFSPRCIVISERTVSATNTRNQHAQPQRAAMERTARRLQGRRASRPHHAVGRSPRDRADPR